MGKISLLLGWGLKKKQQHKIILQHKDHQQFYTDLSFYSRTKSIRVWLANVLSFKTTQGSVGWEHYSETSSGMRFSRMQLFKETLAESLKKCKFETRGSTWRLEYKLLEKKEKKKRKIESRHQQHTANLSFWRKMWRRGPKRKMRIFSRPYFYKVPKLYASRKEQQ